MESINYMVIVFSSLLFLVAGLIYSPVSIHLVFGAPPHPCFGGAQDYDCSCDNNPAKLQATCCWVDPITLMQGCQTCDVNTNTGEFENCHSQSKGRPGSSIIAPPPSGVAPPPSTPTCPENTVLGANGNCAPVTKGPTDQGTTQSPDNAHSKHKPKLSKDGVVLEQLQTKKLTAKKGSNSDNSPTPPACPDKGPIPPNCTLKPKF